MITAALEPTLPRLRSPALVEAPAAGDDPPLLAPGTLLSGAYEVGGLLGSGGMAQVFDGRDRRLGRRVAVKVARAGSGEALRSEGRALAAVRHASVVAVFHAGEHDGLDYLVLEKLSGQSLRDHVEERQRDGARFTIPEVLELVRMIAEALAVVHATGLSHRDLKPENVMLPPGDRIVLTDFGLTRPEFAPGEGRVSGSPGYMAPEVIAGAVRRGHGHLVDLYALGVVAFELLAGRTPFEHESLGEILRAHQFEPPPDPRTLRPDTPGSLADLVLELLAKDPLDRPESAEVVVWRLLAPPGSRRLA